MILKLFDLVLNGIISKESFIILLEMTNFFLYFSVDCIYRKLYLFIKFDCELLDLTAHTFDLFFVLILSELLAVD